MYLGMLLRGVNLVQAIYSTQRGNCKLDGGSIAFSTSVKPSCRQSHCSDRGLL
jgi:hypothetical protein